MMRLQTIILIIKANFLIMYVNLAQYCLHGQKCRLDLLYLRGHGNHVTFTLLKCRLTFTAFVIQVGSKLS